jgi:hypothetical protein
MLEGLMVGLDRLRPYAVIRGLIMRGAGAFRCGTGSRLAAGLAARSPWWARYMAN